MATGHNQKRVAHPSVNVASLIDLNNPEEVQLFVKRQSILEGDYFKELNNTLRRLCMMYKEFKLLTPIELNQEFKKLEDYNFQDIPFKKAEFDDLVTYLKYLPSYIKFCGEPSLHCEIQAVVPEHLEHLAEFFKRDRANRIPGYDIHGNRIFFLSLENQWEIVEYVLRQPLGVSFQDIEENFIRKFELDVKYEMQRCEHLMHFLKHTDLFIHNGLVFHQIYFDKKRTKHLYLKDGQLDEDVVKCLNKYS